jgi:hypothetical protein
MLIMSLSIGCMKLIADHLGPPIYIPCPSKILRVLHEKRQTKLYQLSQKRHIALIRNIRYQGLVLLKTANCTGNAFPQRLLWGISSYRKPGYRAVKCNVRNLINIGTIDFIGKRPQQRRTWQGTKLQNGCDALEQSLPPLVLRRTPPPPTTAIRFVSFNFFVWRKIKENICWAWVAMSPFFKNGVFWDVTPCGSCKNRHFGGT